MVRFIAGRPGQGGFGFQGYSGRASWERAENEPGVGAALKQRLRTPGAWGMTLVGFLRGRSMNIYAGASRVVGIDDDAAR